MTEIQHLETEQRNNNTQHIDELSTIDMIKMINEEDKKVADAVEKNVELIAKAVDCIEAQIRKGGRLIYCGCGTSGRIGVLDAVECPPTYSTDPSLVQGIIAGGYSAMFQAVEGAEDDTKAGEMDLKERVFTSDDVLVGISASGRTPYVVGAMKYAKKLGANVISVTCCTNSEMGQNADIDITLLTGPEVITGSTRMKSGTAQKMVLNMLSTGTMIKLGKVYGNLMVDVMPTNQKLVKRCVSIVCTATGVTDRKAIESLEACQYNPKTAIVMIECNVEAETAKKMLAASKGKIARAILQFKGGHA